MIDVTFYKDKAKRTLNPQLFSTVADSVALKIHEAGKLDRDKNKGTQIRKFYDEVVRLNSIARTSSQEWDNILPYVNMLIAKATYAEGRKLVTSDFVAFMKGAIDQIQQPQDLDIFANFFEAFMGFYKKHSPSN